MCSRTGSNWSQEAYIKAVNSDTDDRFGSSVSLFENTLAVGAHYENSNQTTITNSDTASSDNSSTNSGAVYIYTWSGSIWTQEAHIKAANNDISDEFGFQISLSSDTLAVGAKMEDSNQTSITTGPTASTDNSNTDSGAVYLYSWSGNTWTQIAYIKTTNNEVGDSFGDSISLSRDTLAVGASMEDSNQNIITNAPTASDDNSSSDSGAVYVYY